MLALALILTGCGTKVYLKSYTIENPTGNYTRLRIGVPTAGAGAGTTYKVTDRKYGGGALNIIDPENILVIVQNEVIRSLQSSGRKVALVDTNADLDLQISFQPPSPTFDLWRLVTLGLLKNYASLGGARLVDTRTGNVLFTYEFVSSNRTVVPPVRIQDWETFAKALATEINKTLGTLKLATAPVQMNITAG